MTPRSRVHAALRGFRRSVCERVKNGVVKQDFAFTMKKLASRPNYNSLGLLFDQPNRPLRFRKLQRFSSNNWCRRPDLNRHELGSLPPQDSVSTNSTTSAFWVFIFLKLHGLHAAGLPARQSQFARYYGISTLSSQRSQIVIVHLLLEATAPKSLGLILRDTCASRPSTTKSSAEYQLLSGKEGTSL